MLKDRFFLFMEICVNFVQLLNYCFLFVNKCFISLISNNDKFLKDKAKMLHLNFYMLNFRCKGALCEIKVLFYFNIMSLLVVTL